MTHNNERLLLHKFQVAEKAWLQTAMACVVLLHVSLGFPLGLAGYPEKATITTMAEVKQGDLFKTQNWHTVTSVPILSKSYGQFWNQEVGKYPLLIMRLYQVDTGGAKVFPHFKLLQSHKIKQSPGSWGPSSLTLKFQRQELWISEKLNYS